MNCEKQLKEALKKIDKDNVVILGVGSRLRGDDGVGSIIGGLLEKAFPGRAYDVSTVPENYIGKILSAGKKNIIFIDTLAFGGKPGEYRFVEMSEIYDGLLSTHGSSLTFLLEVLGEGAEGVTAYVLGIEPADTSVSETLTPEIERTMKNILEILTNWLNK
ncbi:MAG: hydrogenase maturation protease [Acidobacteria bacterium]|nr:hydrogenase maturation protease [Acidobacteriota bacterium]